MKDTFEGADELVILVDQQDNEIGVQDKLSVHQIGLLHRAFSVFVFNSNAELLLQQRADGKYHSPGLWTNTCCSHPRPGEKTPEACQRRLKEEMGMTCGLKFCFSFLYNCRFPNGLTEHEFDHVFMGITDDLPEINKLEVKDWRYINIPELQQEIELNPGNFTEWLKICIPKLTEHPQFLSQYNCIMKSDNSLNKNILITGASGLIGARLVKNLQEKGHKVSVLSRKPSNLKGVTAYRWDIDKQEIDLNAFTGIDTIIHLAGAGIADKRWTKRRKKEIVDSRVRSTQLLYKTISATNSPIKTIISASAVGYYGDRGNEILKEESKNGTGFLAECCKQWEDAVDEGSKLGIRVVKLRIGIVLSKQGGALLELSRPVNFFVGAPLGSGKQWMPWIHLTDLLSVFENAIDKTEYTGTLNACSQFPVTNLEFTKLLAKKLFRPVWPIKVPEFVLKAILGEMSTVVLISNRTSPQKLLDLGFRFRYPGLDAALTEIYSH